MQLGADRFPFNVFIIILLTINGGSKLRKAGQNHERDDDESQAERADHNDKGYISERPFVHPLCAWCNCEQLNLLE